MIILYIGEQIHSYRSLPLKLQGGSFWTDRTCPFSPAIKEPSPLLPPALLSILLVTLVPNATSRTFKDTSSMETVLGSTAPRCLLTKVPGIQRSFSLTPETEDVGKAFTRSRMNVLNMTKTLLSPSKCHLQILDTYLKLFFAPQCNFRSYNRAPRGAYFWCVSPYCTLFIEIEDPVR